MPVSEVYNEDVLSGMAKLADESVDCIITSPPYYQLRDYRWDGQWGLEPTFQQYLEHLWQFMDEVKRVLKQTGTVWVNLGDTYASVSGGMGDGFQGNKATAGIKYATLQQTKQSMPNKCLMLLPHRFAIGCIDRGWIMRNDCIWAKRNGMPESVTDRFSKKHEYFFLMVKNEDYYFDLDGIRDKHLTTTPQIREKNKEGYNNAGLNGDHFSKGVRNFLHENGKNPGSVSDFWDIPTQPSSEDHYATYNTKLIDKPIVAGCPKGGTILDPFMGTGTTGLRALELGRNFIGIEGSTKHFNDAKQRLDIFQSQKVLF